MKRTRSSVGDDTIPDFLNTSPTLTKRSRGRPYFLSSSTARAKSTLATVICQRFSSPLVFWLAMPARIRTAIISLESRSMRSLNSTASPQPTEKAHKRSRIGAKRRDIGVMESPLVPEERLHALRRLVGDLRREILLERHLHDLVLQRHRLLHIERLVLHRLQRFRDAIGADVVPGLEARQPFENDVADGAIHRGGRF